MARKLTGNKKRRVNNETVYELEWLTDAEKPSIFDAPTPSNVPLSRADFKSAYDFRVAYNTAHPAIAVRDCGPPPRPPTGWPLLTLVFLAALVLGACHIAFH